MQISSIARWLLNKPGSTGLAPLSKLLPQVAGHEQRLRGLSDGELTAAAQAARDDAEICACGREAARRALGERPYDVQVLGVLAMLSGLVAEMETGEGKTLSGALAAAGYALGGRRVHVMSVNDYLARRDAEWMRPVYDLLGVTVGWIGQASAETERRRAYASQVTYAPVSEFGFDVLRDRLVTDVAGLVADDPDVVVIDEADSVLIDEARVPLVLAGAADSADADREMARIAAGLHPGEHYEVDEDARNVSLTSAGAGAAERALGGINLYTTEHAEALTRLNVALHAQALLQRDVDYIVRDGAVHLINESRGRVARRQRWPDGLHAAVEAKEGLAASESGEVLDSITIQSLVRRYRTVCGMTGTAVAAGEQFREFYGLEIAVIPPNRPCVRADQPDRLYPTVREKEEAVVGEVAAAHATGRPVLIGTLDVAESERLAGELGRAGLRCAVLNAKNDAQEAAIVAEAGAHGAITVSTQMAGRGTDIRLGGTHGDRDLIARLGGLYVIGTGRHASSRLDKQLRGRAGRQGDPGGSVFFASMEDQLILQYAPEQARAEILDARAHGEVRAHRVLGHAQRVAEGANLEIHRNTWQYSKLIEDQRRIVLQLRERVLRSDHALSALAARCPQRLAELNPGIEQPVLASAARQIMLFHLDRAWAEHLAFLADLREGIHLRALARGTVPLNEFNREAIGAFAALLEEAAARSAQTFRCAPITAGGVDLEAIGLKRPTATWTYLVHDNPFGTDIDRALRSIARRARKLVVLGRQADGEPGGFKMPNVDNGDAPPQIDTSRPHPARVYDYFLGGKDNFAADREVARQALAVAPSFRTAVRENRAFLGRAVRFLVEEAGITQFLDLGSGLPGVGNVHEVAQAVQPSARVVYVDNDPIVLAHGRALLTSTPEGKCAYLQADIRDPQYILRHPLTSDTLDFGQPVALILNAVLHFFADEQEPAKIVETLLEVLPSGSYVAASHGTAEYSPPQRVDGGVRAYQQGGMPVYMRDGSEFADLAFKGLTLVPPGVVAVSEWRREPSAAIPPPTDEIGINGAVARKP